MAFASTNDVNAHLPDDKAQGSDEDYESLHIDAERLIVGRLASTVQYSIMVDWDTPEDTPGIIRHISSLIVAAKFYSKLAAEDEADGSQFANDLYNQALMEIDKILSGATVIIGVDGEPIDLDITSDLRFYPNAAAPDPFFAIAQEFS
jgi:hypothetical protein